MLENLDRTRGLVFSQAVLLALTRAGLAREDAYAIVQRHSMEVWATGKPLRDLLAADPAVRRALSEEELSQCFEPARYLRHVDAIFARVLAE